MTYQAGLSNSEIVTGQLDAYNAQNIEAFCGFYADDAVLAERKQLARDALLDDDDRAWREMRLNNLPPSTAAAVNELASYDWQSAIGWRVRAPG